jgi:hypothetical protein
MGLLANIKKLLSGDARTEAEKLTFGRIPASNVSWEHDPTPREPGTAYYQLWLQEMWLRYSREWLSEFTPVVYTVVTLSFGDAQSVEIPASLGEFKFDGEIDNIDHALKLNYPMTPQLPFNGGVVEIDAALVALETEDGLDELINAVTDLSGVLAVPQLSAVVSVAAPVANTLNALLGQSAKRLALGLHQSFKHGSEEQLCAGYYVALSSADAIDVSQLSVSDEGRLCWTQSGEAVREFDFMLFRLETSSERDDLDKLSNIFDSMEKARAAAAGAVTVPERMPEAKAWLTTACLTALESDDLTRVDRRRVPLALRQQFDDDLLALGLVGDGAGVDEPVAAATINDLVAEQTAEAQAEPEGGVLARILEP